MVDGDIQNEDSSFLGTTPTDPHEFRNEFNSPSSPPSRQLSNLDVLALSAFDVASFSWDAYVREKAKAIYDETVLIRGLFGALDGLIISYSTFKYIFDFITPANLASSDALHDWVMTGSGAIATCGGSLALITLSLVGNIFDDNHKNALIRSMVTIWPYVRDGFKGLKFAYKGVRSTVLAAQVMGFDCRSMILPLGLVLGVAAAANRIWYRNQVTEKRKDYQKINNLLLKRAQNLHNYELDDASNLDNQHPKPQRLYLEFDEEDGFVKYRVIDSTGQLVQGKLSLADDLKFNSVDARGEPVIPTIDFLKMHYRDAILSATVSNGHTAIGNTEEARENIRNAIKDESLLCDRRLVIASALFGGFVDGLYTYMGVLGLTILSPQLFGAMAVCCMIFTVICVINRYYEEDRYQNEFLRSKLNVQLVLAAKEIQDTFLKIQRHSLEYYNVCQQVKNQQTDVNDAQAMLKKKNDMGETSTALKERLISEIDALRGIKQQYDAVCEDSIGRVILMGLRSGLYFYSAASSVMLAYAAFCATFPPALLVTAVAIGIASLIAFAVHAAIVHCMHCNEKEVKKVNVDLRAYADVILERLISGEEVVLNPTVESQALQDSMSIDPGPLIDYQPAFEVVRSCCSGLPKGNKGLDFVGERWLEPDTQGHYQETTWMGALGVVFSLFYAVVYALRAFGKGFRGANDVPLATLHPVQSFFDTSGLPSPMRATPTTDNCAENPLETIVEQRADHCSENSPSPINVDSKRPTDNFSEVILEKIGDQREDYSLEASPMEQPSSRSSSSPVTPPWNPRMFAAVGGAASNPDFQESSVNLAVYYPDSTSEFTP